MSVCTCSRGSLRLSSLSHYRARSLSGGGSRWKRKATIGLELPSLSRVFLRPFRLRAQHQRVNWERSQFLAAIRRFQRWFCVSLMNAQQAISISFFVSLRLFSIGSWCAARVFIKISAHRTNDWNTINPFFAAKHRVLLFFSYIIRMLNGNFIVQTVIGYYTILTLYSKSQ